MDDQTIECGRCGESVYAGLTRCPHCGVSFYEPEDDEGDHHGHNVERSWKDAWLFRPLAFAYGWVGGGVLVFTLHLVLRRFYEPGALTIAGWIFVTVTEMVGMFAGGYLTGALIEKKFTYHISLYTLLSVFSLILLEGFWQELGLVFFTQTVHIVRWVVILACGAVGFLLASKEHLRVQQPDYSLKEGEDIYWDLLLKVRFDRDAAERLIEYERQYVPNASKAELIQRAINRWEKDNR